MADYVINGKKTTHGHIVHYIDHGGVSHAAIIKHLAPASDGGFTADLQVFHRSNGSSQHESGVPYSVEGFPHTWNHPSTEAESAPPPEKKSAEKKDETKKE